MNDLIDFIKLSYGSDCAQWRPIYTCLRRIYGESFVTGQRPAQAEDYKISRDLYTIRRKLGRSEEIRREDIASDHVKQLLDGHSVLPPDKAANLMDAPGYSHYFDIIFLVDMIERDIRKDKAAKRIPMWSGIIAAGAALAVCVINNFYAGNADTARQLRELNTRTDAIYQKVMLRQQAKPL